MKHFHVLRAARMLLAAPAVLALLSACASEPPRKPPFQVADANYPGALRPASEYPADVLLRQRVTASWGEGAARGERGFDGVFQKQGDTLTLVGLSPLGSAGFVVKLTGAEVSFENRTQEELPFPPRFILLDVQRVFFPWLAGAGVALPDGERDADVGDEHVTERWEGGQLVERRFTRRDGRPAGTIIVRYSGDRAGRVAPPHAELDNGWLGYRLTVDTLQETLLDALPR